MYLFIKRAWRVQQGISEEMVFSAGEAAWCCNPDTHQRSLNQFFTTPTFVSCAL